MTKTDLFKDISVTDLNNSDIDKYAELLGPSYDQFSKFWGFLKETCDSDPLFESSISKVGCSISGNDVMFTATLSDGSDKTIRFDRPGEMKETPDFVFNMTSKSSSDEKKRARNTISDSECVNMSLADLETMSEQRDLAELEAKKIK